VKEILERLLAAEAEAREILSAAEEKASKMIEEASRQAQANIEARRQQAREEAKRLIAAELKKAELARENEIRKFKENLSSSNYLDEKKREGLVEEVFNTLANLRH